MTDQDKTTIISELISAIETSCRNINLIVEAHRKESIGILWALKESIDMEDIDSVLENVERTNKLTKSLLEGM